MHLNTAIFGAIATMLVGWATAQYTYVTEAPYCAELCLLENLNIAPACSLTNLSCYCTTTGFLNTFESCALAGCSATDVSSTIAYIEGLCYYGPKVPTCAESCYVSTNSFASGCNTALNQTCACTDNTYLYNWLECIIGSCSSADQTTAVAELQKDCGWA